MKHPIISKGEKMKNIIKLLSITSVILTLWESAATGQLNDKAVGVSRKSKQKEAVHRDLDFALRTIEGKEVRLRDYAGKVVLVNIWAPWCGPCRAETPGFVSLYEKYKGKGFEIISVAVNTNESDVKSFISQHGVRWLVGISDAIATKFRTTAIPDNFLLGPDGRIVKHWVGFTGEEELKMVIEQTLNKPS